MANVVVVSAAARQKPIAALFRATGKESFELGQALDSRHCLHLLDQDPAVALVFIDSPWNLAELIEFLTAIRMTKGSVPVLIASTGVDEEARGILTSFGAVDLIQLPFGADELGEKIGRLSSRCDTPCFRELFRVQESLAAKRVRRGGRGQAAKVGERS